MNLTVEQSRLSAGERPHVCLQGRMPGRAGCRRCREACHRERSSWSGGLLHAGARPANGERGRARSLLSPPRTRHLARASTSTSRVRTCRLRESVPRVGRWRWGRKLAWRCRTCAGDVAMAQSSALSIRSSRPLDLAHSDRFARTNTRPLGMRHVRDPEAAATTTGLTTPCARRQEGFLLDGS